MMRARAAARRGVDTAPSACKTRGMKPTASALCLLLAAAACGSSEPTTASTPSSAPAAGEQAAKSEGDDGHHRLTPELKGFHDLLSPLWHADKGEARRADTCKAVPDFKTRAAAVKAAAPPASVDPAGWTAAGSDLEGAVAGLETACAGSDPAAFDTAFEAVHTRFHHAMELQVGEHDMQGEHAGDHEGRGEHEAGAGHGQKEGDH